MVPRVFLSVPGVRKCGHFQPCESGFGTLVAGSAPRPLEGLFRAVAGEDSEDHWHPRVQAHLHDAQGSLAADELEVGGLTADDGSQGDNRMVLAGLRQPFRGQRQLEGPGYPSYGDVVLPHIGFEERFHGSSQKPVGDRLVELRDGDSQPPAAAVYLVADEFAHGATPYTAVGPWTTRLGKPLHDGEPPSILGSLRRPLTRVTDTVWFWIVFPITLALLSVALWTGRRKRRRVHLLLAPLSMVFLGLAILLAVRMGQTRDFPAAEMRIHRAIAVTAALLALPVILSGLALFRSPSWRRVHRICVTLFLVAAVAASATGIWVFSMSTPRY